MNTKKRFVTAKRNFLYKRRNRPGGVRYPYTQKDGYENLSLYYKMEAAKKYYTGKDEENLRYSTLL